jgi:RDD family protein
MTTSDDPNAAPRGDSAHSGQQPAGLFRRFFARLIDSWIVVIALIPLVYLLHALTDISAISTPVRLVIIGLILGFATFAYFVVFEVTLGWTPPRNCSGSPSTGQAERGNRILSSRLSAMLSSYCGSLPTKSSAGS